MYWRRMEEEHYWEERRRFEEEMEFYEWQRRRGVPHPRPVPPKPPAALEMHMKRPDTQIDRHVMAKHNTIYPSEQEVSLYLQLITIANNYMHKGAFIVCCNAAAVPMYRLLIYRRSTQRTAAKLKLI